MPAQWTGQLIGEIHNTGFTIQEVARKANLHPKYVSKVLNSEESAEKARKKLWTALKLLQAEREVSTR